MKIENKLILNETAKTTKKTATNFDEILNANLNKKITSNEIENFKQELSKVGASGYLSKLNEDKIAQKLATKQAELEKILGLDDKNKDSLEKSRLSSLLKGFLGEYENSLNERENNTINERQNNLKRDGTFINLAELMSKI
ncbi:hypothetical protein [Campylobacter gastrosuis]|uniref:Uncharacterized protein n=1 Tax=Campylobacter gastrosuis TaxID=2974576 RepID=A0ABT7HSE8_9BACT|nr:hypothetical protein [Campylobacter gastrosuis]MDL0089657.1 hypothetical protein [Campylobacter gastrosuis]